MRTGSNMKTKDKPTKLEINTLSNDKNQIVSKSGGARPGAGRPIGVKDKISIGAILDAIQKETSMNYAEVLATDFEEARRAGDRNAMTKYHSLIITRIAPSLQKVEITDSTIQMEAKAHAFIDAIREVIDKEQTPILSLEPEDEEE